MTQLSCARLGPWRALAFFDEVLPQVEAQLSKDARPFLPPADEVFAALERVPPEAIKVVILGQDPYPTPGHAHGFAFSAAPTTRPLPRSLANIFTEMQADIGAAPRNADLRFWADQGVLMLNTILTVPQGAPLGHKGLGWESLTKEILAALAQRPCAYLLWGAAAQKAAKTVDAVQNLKIETAHPSPLSARRGFFGSRPFSRVNAWLQAQGHDAINWAQPAEDP